MWLYILMYYQRRYDDTKNLKKYQKFILDRKTVKKKTENCFKIRKNTCIT